MIAFILGFVLGLGLGACSGVLLTAILVDSARRERAHLDILEHLDDA